MSGDRVRPFFWAVLTGAVGLYVALCYTTRPQAPSPVPLPAVKPTAPREDSAEPVPPRVADSQARVPIVPIPVRIDPLNGSNGDLPDDASPAEQQRRRLLAELVSSDIPVEQRLERIDTLARTDDYESVQVLMALGSRDADLSGAAIEALARVTFPEVGDYLRGKLVHPDPGIVARAVRSLAAFAGESAIGDIDTVLKNNHRRLDGYEEMVCTACVEALGSLHSAAVLPVLRRELMQTVGDTLHYEYGSAAVDAVRQIGDPAGRPVIEAYMARLRRDRAGMAGNPMGQRYLQQKIGEARAVADDLVPRLQ